MMYMMWDMIRKEINPGINGIDIGMVVECMGTATNTLRNKYTEKAGCVPKPTVGNVRREQFSHVHALAEQGFDVFGITMKILGAPAHTSAYRVCPAD